MIKKHKTKFLRNYSNEHEDIIDAIVALSERLTILSKRVAALEKPTERVPFSDYSKPWHGYGSIAIDDEIKRNTIDCCCNHSFDTGPNLAEAYSASKNTRELLRNEDVHVNIEKLFQRVTALEEKMFEDRYS